MIRNPLIHFIAALILLTVVCVGYGFWYATVEAKSAAIATYEGEIQDKAQDSTRDATAKKELVTLNAAEGTVQQYFISTNDVVPFLEQLTSTGKYLGTTVQVVSVAATPGTPYGQLNLSLKLSGTFDAVLRTIGSIEYGPFGTTLTTFSFDAPNVNAVSSSGQSQVWTASAIFSIGTESGASANADTPAPPVTTPASGTSASASVPTSAPAQASTPVASSTATTSPAALP